MTKNRERTTNLCETTVHSGAVVLNTLTATKILDTTTLEDPRIFYRVNNPSNQDAWIIERDAASVTAADRTILLPKNSMYESMPDNIYIGEISAISILAPLTVYASEC